MQSEIEGMPASSVELPGLDAEHIYHLAKGSGIALDVIRERGYRSIQDKVELEKLGYSASQVRVPGILVPLWGVDGKSAGYQYRPDNPRLDGKGRPVKYESVPGSANKIDCPPRCSKLVADPHVALWITEGSKKADALASHGPCAVSLTGVWGFKGKNSLGGKTFLADWDFIALNGRTIYLTFDSDILTKEPVKKALDNLVEHLRRKEARVLVVHLPQDGDNKTGIDDYLLTHSLEEAKKLASNYTFEEFEVKERRVPGFILPDGTIGEMVISEDEDRTFVVVVNGSVRQARYYQTPKAMLVPTGDLLAGEVVHFATTATPYISQAALFAEVRSFVHKYLELPPNFEEIASLYVLLSWVFEFSPSIPYLRVIGDWGSGKTRFLQVVGAVCFRPIFASGATTPAPIFRILEEFRGTLVLDEADFKDSSAWVEMVKLLNNGYRPGMPVLRADKEDGKWFPRSYQVFGPKLIATRFPFKDEALESRCLTAEMASLTRDDIPRVLPQSFDREVKDLRSKLLTFRLANLMTLKGKTFGNELLEPGLQPRLQELLIPLRVMLNGDDSMSGTLAAFVHRLQESLFVRRQESDTGRILAAVIELHNGGHELSSKNIADKANQMDPEDTPIAPEKIGWLTRKLGLIKTRVPGNGRRVIQWEDENMRHLAARYGLKTNSPLSPPEPSHPSQPSHPASKTREGSREGFPSEPEPSQKPSREIEANREGLTGCEGFLRDKDPILGMTREEAIQVWSGAGKPVIELGPGERCLDLEKLLSHPDVLDRHLKVIAGWLKERQ